MAHATDDIIAALGDLAPTGPPARVVDQTTAAFEALGNADDAAGVESFMPGTDHTYGLKVPVIRKLAKHIARTYKTNPGLCASIARASWARPSREHRILAIFIIENSRIDSDTRWQLGLDFLPGVLTWEDCDQLSYATFGYVLCHQPERMDQFESWTNADAMWQRRAALVAVTQLRKANKLDPALALDLDRRGLEMCKKLLCDDEPYVQKAIDWVVREVLRRHYDLTRDWLFEQAQSDLSRKAQSTLKKSAKKLNENDQQAFIEILSG